MDAGNLNEILSSLTNEDIASLQAMASSIFGQKGKDGGGDQSGKQTQGEEHRQSQPQENILSGMMDMDPKTMAAIASVMGKLGQSRDDDRTRFIAALRPLLSEKRRQRADQAIKIMQLFEILPLLKDSGIF